MYLLMMYLVVYVYTERRMTLGSKTYSRYKDMLKITAISRQLFEIIETILNKSYTLP